MESRGPVIAPTYKPSFPPEPGSETPSSLQAVPMLSLCWRHRVFLWRVLWMSFVLSTVVAFLLPKHFKSTARLVVPDNQTGSNLSGLLNRASAGGPDLGLDPSSLLGLKTPAAFYAAVLQSRTVQDRLVDKFDLRAHYRKKYYEDARKKLARNTEVTEEKKSGVITLSVTDWDARFAAMLARSYIEEMNRAAVDLNVSGAHLEREFVEGRLNQARLEMDRASMELSQFSSKHSVMDPQQQGRTMLDAAADLQGQLIGSEAELKGLEQIYSQDNVRVRKLKAQVAEMQSELKKMVGNYTAPGATAGEQASGTYPSIRTLPALGYRYQTLYQETKIRESVLDFLTRQYEAARVAEARELPVFRIMDQPDIPEKKDSPTRSLIVAVSVVMAFMVGCWWLWIREQWERLPAGDSRRLLLDQVKADLRRPREKAESQNN